MGTTLQLLKRLAVILVVAVGGCSMMDDNPTSAEKMTQIRKAEAQSRANFHPTGQPPAAGQTPPAGTPAKSTG